MPKLVIEEPHSLSRPEAMKRLRAAADRAAAKHGATVEQPSEYELVTAAFGATGRMTCDDKRVVIELDLPLAAWLFRSRIETEARREIRAVLDGKNSSA